MKKKNKFYTISEYAILCGIPLSAVRWLIKNNKLEIKKNGKKYVIPIKKYSLYEK